MKKTILALTVLMLAGASFAQPTPGDFPKGPRQEMRGGGIQRDFDKLNLSDAQKQQVKTINDDFRKQMQDLMAKENITVKQQRDQRDALQKAHKQKIENILTPDQKEQLAKLKADALKKRAELDEQRLARLKEKLSLSDAQVATIRTNQQKTQDKFEKLVNDEKVSGSDRHEQMMKLHDEMKSNIESVLTPGQKSKMDTLQNHRNDRREFGGHHNFGGAK